MNRFDIDAEQFLQRYIELNPKHEDVVMTMGRQLKQRVVIEGAQHGKYEIPKDMLRKGLDDMLITETTVLSATDLEKLKLETRG